MADCVPHLLHSLQESFLGLKKKKKSRHQRLQQTLSLWIKGFSDVFRFYLKRPGRTRQQTHCSPILLPPALVGARTATEGVGSYPHTITMRAVHVKAIGHWAQLSTCRSETAEWDKGGIKLLITLLGREAVLGVAALIPEWFYSRDSGPGWFNLMRSCLISSI